MAYIGVPPADRTSGARVRDEFTADGTQVCFQLSQEVPGSFESNIIAIVENVIQEPVSAYTIINTVTLSLTNISDTFVLNETVTGGSSSAEGIVIQANLSNIVVRVTSGTFQVGEEITGGGSSATADTTAVETNVGRGVLFSGTPTNGSAVYFLHQNSATYQLKPAAGSVTPETLSENLRTFTVDKFTATASQTAFTLTATPVSVKSILVFVDGVMQTETTHYTLSGAVVTMGSGLTEGQQVTVVHLGFSTVSRTAFADSSITTAMLADGSITSSKIANGTVIAADVADGTITLAKLSATGTKDATTFLRGDNSFAVVSVTPTAVSDQANTSTGYFDLPSGTTAQRPGSPATGNTRYNTDTSSIEFYNGSGWSSTNLVPYINSITGTIYAGSSTTLSLSLSNTTETVTVRFSEGGTTVKDVTGVTVTTGSASVTVPSEVYDQTAGDTMVITVLNSDGTPSSNSISKTVGALPTGGTITTSSSYRIHSFTSSSTFATGAFAGTVEYLIVAGGGGGGQSDAGGGGGAGGMLTGSATATASQSYSVTVGSGGAAGGPGSNGGNSSIATLVGTTALGGGGGGKGNGNTTGTGNGVAGGSGGGGGWGGRAGGAGTAGQGNNGGAGNGSQGGATSGGGGGGAGASGGNNTDPGNGGVGVASSITGSSVYYAGGGGSGTDTTSSTGGNGGGGAGGRGNPAYGATAGTANTGGGGGGGRGYSGGSDGGAGGSGIVVVRYQLG